MMIERKRMGWLLIVTLVLAGVAALASRDSASADDLAKVGIERSAVSIQAFSHSADDRL